MPKSLIYINRGSRGALAKKLSKWGATQTLNIREQLEAGVRYFDIRACVNPQNTDFYFLHGLYGPRVQPCLEEINEFLNINKQEVVFLDFHNVYNMNDISHRQLLNKVSDIFHGKLCQQSETNDTKTSTLKQLWRTPCRVFVYYQNEKIVQEFPEFWRKSFIPSLGSKATDLDEMTQTLDEYYRGRKRSGTGDMFVWSGSLTSKPVTLVKNLHGSRLKNLSTDATANFVDWLQDKRPGIRGINICSADFVEQRDFIRTVIELNFKNLHW